MQTETTLPAQPDLFDQQDLLQYQDATLGQRFFNLLIDNLLMQYGLSYATGMLVGYAIVSFFSPLAEAIFEEGGRTNLLLLSYIIGVVNYICYYTFCENIFKGYTLGKLITGTRAIRQDGQELTFKDALLRSLSRIVPFETFSAFGRQPWHDSWTKTMVIKSR